MQAQVTQQFSHSTMSVVVMYLAQLLPDGRWNYPTGFFEGYLTNEFARTQGVSMTQGDAMSSRITNDINELPRRLNIARTAPRSAGF